MSLQNVLLQERILLGYIWSQSHTGASAGKTLGKILFK